MRRGFSALKDLDWLTLGLYFLLVIMGWFAIYAAGFDAETPGVFDLSQSHGKQLLWIGAALVVALFIVIIDSKFYTTFTYVIYALVIVLLIAVLLFAREVSGARSWLEIGGFKLQPAEFAKLAVALALAKYLSSINVTIASITSRILATLLIVSPAVLIILQGDTGSALVYAAFILVLYREGLSGELLMYGALAAALFIITLVVDKYLVVLSLLIITGVVIYFSQKKKHIIRAAIIMFIGAAAFTLVVDYAFNNILNPEQQERISVLVGESGDDWNVSQSKIAIGSGGFTGKGFLNGTQTKFDFVPEQSTDFIFCTIGEEQGFIGSFFLIAVFVALLLRIIHLAERQRSQFARIYAYGVVSVLFFHMTVNIGMTIGLLPIIGIPMPFISYGGSSMLAFTAMIFILVKLDAERLVFLR